MKTYYVYIMTNKTGTLYTGVTNDLLRRVYEHKQKVVPGFTMRYNITRLVYFEETSDIQSAIRREKQIKGWLRSKKIALIESMNPGWKDVSDPWVASISDGHSAHPSHRCHSERSEESQPINDTKAISTSTDRRIDNPKTRRSPHAL
jgi:putative endonuclease